jgi:hypothetical protein
MVILTIKMHEFAQAQSSNCSWRAHLAVNEEIECKQISKGISFPYIWHHQEVHFQCLFIP